MTMKTHPSRRSVLRTLALGASGVAAGLPAPGGLSRVARAAAAAPPRRIVFLYLPNGIRYDAGAWEKSWVQPGATATTFTTAGMTTPLEPFKQDLVFIDGMNIMGKGDAHIDNIHKILTGGEMLGLGKADGISVDQHLAQKVGRALTPKLPSLELGVQTWGGKSGWAHLADGTPVPALENPYTVYEKLFATLPAQGAPPDPALGRRLLVRKSVLDSVAKDLVRFRARLPAEDRARAEAQLDAVRSMEQRLSTAAGAPTGTCGKPKLAEKVNIKDPKALRDVTRMQFDLLTAAFACDLTRISTVMFFDWRIDPFTWNFAPVNNPTYLHLLSHDFLDDFVVAKRVLFEEVAYFADKLKKIPEGGGTMLDNTTIVCTTEISTGHTGRRIPWVTIGGKGMGVQTGRYLKVPSTSPHNQLLTSFLNAMGLPDQSFGKTDWGTGPLPGYLA